MEQIIFEKKNIDNINRLLDYLIDLAETGDKIENEKTNKTGEGVYTHFLKIIKEEVAKGKNL